MPNRDNGFVARHYVPLADLDPRLADAMLDLLRDEGIAAYASPSTGRLGGYLEVILPERPRDRLWVDREQRDRAAGLLTKHTDPESIGHFSPAEAAAIAHETPGSELTDQVEHAGDSDGSAEPEVVRVERTDTSAAAASGDLLDKPSPAAPSPSGGPVAAPPAGTSAATDSAATDTGDTDTGVERAGAEGAEGATADGDLAWAAVLASFELPAYETPAAPGTDTRQDHPVPRRVVRPAEPTASPLHETPVPAAAAPDEAATSGWDPLDLLDEHFVPPQPPAPPRLQTATRWALAAIICGLGLVVGPRVSDSMPEGAAALGVFLMIGGLVALVANMREDHDDDRDDGAVV
jgi:hypothetical protein